MTCFVFLQCFAEEDVTMLVKKKSFKENKLLVEVFIPSKNIISQVRYKTYPLDGISYGVDFKPVSFVQKLEHVYQFEIDQGKKINDDYTLHTEVTLKHYNVFALETKFSRGRKHYFIIPLEKSKQTTQEQRFKASTVQ